MGPPEPLLWPPGWRRRTSGTTTSATAPARPGRPPPPARLELRTGGVAVHHAIDVEDEEVLDLDGHPVTYRRFGHREDGAELVSEEWTWQVDDVLHVLTGTVRRDGYLEVCDLFETAAASVDVDQLRGR